MLDALLENTPSDHPDQEEIPTVRQILAGALKGSQVCHGRLSTLTPSQPGIESAEAKIKLWNVAERLLFKKGEIVVRS